MKALIFCVLFWIVTCAPPSHQPSSSSSASNEQDAQASPDDIGASLEREIRGDGAPLRENESETLAQAHVIIGLEEARSLPYALTPIERIRAAARVLLEVGDPLVWGRDGQLSPRELSNPFLSNGLEGVEAFNVLDSNGYEGDYKCNLLAFELAYRAGLLVPLMGRGRGWGYPGPGVVTEQVERGHVLELWASRVERTDLEHLRAMIDVGAALMIVGQGRYGGPGHVGIVGQVHSVLHAPDGRLAQIEYSGWEANPQGGSYGRRTWKPGRYSLIHLIELREPPPGEPQVVPIGFGPLRASLEDADRSTAESRTLGRGHGDSLPIRGRGLPALPVAHGLLGGRSNFGQVVNVRRIARDDDNVNSRGDGPAGLVLPPLPPYQVPANERPDLDTEQVLQRLGIRPRATTHP